MVMGRDLGTIKVVLSDELEDRIRDRFVRKKGDISIWFGKAADHYLKCPEAKKEK